MGKYKKRYYRGSRDKYSIEQNACAITVPLATVSGPGQSGIVVVPPTTTQGMRKVKHISISLAAPSSSSSATFPSAVFWALVYVPQGTGVGTININTSSATQYEFYEPNQFVMNCGVADFEAGPVRFYSPLSRNLNSGDQIALVLANPSTQGTIGIDAVVRYAITLQ